PAAPERDGDVSVDALVREWLLELKVMGRSPRTVGCYAQKMRSYLAASNATRLSELTAFELKRFLGELRDRGLAQHNSWLLRNAEGARQLGSTRALPGRRRPVATPGAQSARERDGDV